MSDLFAWRAPLDVNWTERWREIDALVRQRPFAEAEAVSLGARRLANQRLGPQEQLKLEGLARRLLPLREKLDLRGFRLGLLSNRTLRLLIDPLRAAGLTRGLLVDAVDAPYDSAARFAFGAKDVFATKLDAVVAVLDRDAFGQPGVFLGGAAAQTAIDDASAYLQRLVAAARNSGASAIVATIPMPPAPVSALDAELPGTDAHFIAKLNDVIRQGAARSEWILWDLAGLAARVGYDAWFDPVRFHEAKLPFAAAMHPPAADHLCRTLAAMTGKSCRALLLDLDDTLWGGMIGDDGAAGIRLGSGSAEGEAFLAFQRFLLDLRRRGVVLAVCSKNTEHIAREPFRAHPEMLLREDDFSVFQANWDDKAANVRAIAAQLGLGLESLAFADDNPAERERIRQALPQVSVPELGSDPAYFAARIADSGVFEHLLLNEADLGRAESYRVRAAGGALRSDAASYTDYLRSLGMTLTVSRFAPADTARLAQLMAKSNQFNLTTRRYGEQDVPRLADDGDILCWQARLDDKFTSHGIIAIVIARKNGAVWAIDSWVQSCRVLGRGVEDALMNALFAEAQTSGAETITGTYIPTPRNGLVADFFPKLGFAALPGDASQFVRAVKDYSPRAN